MRILVIGSGGREHAIVRALSRDTAELHVAPGNPGMAELAQAHPGTAPTPAGILGLAREIGPDLVVIGPEAPLVAGAADALRGAGLSCFGPAADAAMIEGSKSFAKQVMAEAGIPTAAAFTCRTSAEVDAALTAFGPPYVVKDDALAAGKGVLVTADLTAARAHARACGTVVIEEFLDGPEVSLFAITDGRTAVPLMPAQDFKRAGDGDQGPNTGGMGAYVPLPWAPEDLTSRTMDTIVGPAVDVLRRRGTRYAGLLYVGLALTSAGLRVVEFNARFGDPETQVILDRLSSPLAPLLAAAAVGDLASVPPPTWRPGAAVTVVFAAEGYPEAPVKGDKIKILHAERAGLLAPGQTGSLQASAPPGSAPQAQATHLASPQKSQATANSQATGEAQATEAYILHAGTAIDADGDLVSAGGRVLDVVGSGADLAAARGAAYELAGMIEMRGGWYRHDIAELASK